MSALKYSIGSSGHEVTCYFDAFASLIEKISSGRRNILLLDENVKQKHDQIFKGFECIIISSGEQFKVQATVDVILEELLRMEADKEVLLIGIGGGVVTDVAGYTASVYKRGVSFVLVPTTLLAMVDAALGGKNGVNIGLAKNIIGTIYQPEAIIFDFQLLKTLPSIEWESGMAEIIKHACIADSEMFAWLEKADPEFYLHQPEVFRDLVRKNVALKMNIVIKDAHDKADRLLLNFGHTLGHALENLKHLPHGHAVSIGMMFAAFLSVRLKGLPEADLKRIENLLLKFNLPVKTDASLDQIFQVLLLDKKRSNNAMRYVLLSTLGCGEVNLIQFDFLRQELKNFL